jgi:hypothetical protein
VHDDHLPKRPAFSRRMFVVVMIPKTSTGCLPPDAVGGEGELGVEGQVKFVSGRCYENTTRFVCWWCCGATWPWLSWGPCFGASKALMWVFTASIERRSSCSSFGWLLSIWISLGYNENSKDVRFSSEQEVVSVYQMLTKLSREYIIRFSKILDHVAC